MATQAKIDFNLLAEGQANGWATANTAFNLLASSGSLEILDRDLSTPPGSPSDGDAYIVKATGTGAWAGEDGNIAVYYSGWYFFGPEGGMAAYVKDEKTWWGYSSQESAWHPLQRYHSTTEQWTGRYDRTGSKIYCKTVDCGAMPNTTNSTDAHGISNLDVDKRILADGWMSDGTDSLEFPGSLLAPTRITAMHIDTTNIEIRTNWDASSWDGEVYMEYCKTA